MNLDRQIKWSALEEASQWNGITPKDKMRAAREKKRTDCHQNSSSLTAEFTKTMKAKR